MKKYFLALNIVFFSTCVSAGEPFKSPDALEKELIACLTNKKVKPEKCMQEILGPHVLPGNDQMVGISKEMDDFFLKWLANDSVFAVHPIRAKKAGDIYEKRTYLIEDTTGSLMAFNFTSLKKLGKWYVFQFNLSSKEDELDAVMQGGD